MTETDGTAALARHGYTLTKRTPQHERYDTMPQSACVKFMVVGGRWCGKVESIGSNAVYAPLGLLEAVVARLGELDGTGA